MTKTKFPPQKPDELEKMADFYSKHYSQVYFVRCLKTDLIVAVECFPAKLIEGFDAIRVKRHNGDRDIYGYQGLFLTTRERLDKTPDGHHMIGYESLTGNDTRLSKFERGTVVPVKIDKNTIEETVQSSAKYSNPFERSMLESEVAIKQAGAGEQSDYELKYSKTGMTIERFESFQVERVR